ncbi:MAG: 4-hydroxybenzoate polyprenyltransferase [Alphaproteobacteria bacterium]|nr:4-hydroxybenzoate polyprenyltransferase [Alphaproteobacteria bacterium]
MAGNDEIICVDLDGTLIRSDLSWNSAEKFVKKDFFNIFKLIFWYFKGVPYLKYRVAKEVEVDPSALPYNSDFLSYLIQKKAEGSKIYLATGSTEKYAKQVANYLRIFDGVFASDLKTNLVGKNKAQKLANLFTNGFTYAGNSVDDLHVWKKSSKKILVNPSEKTQKAMHSVKYTLYKS